MMQLDPHDLSLFYTLHKALMFFVNQRLDVIQKPLDSPEQVGKLPPDDRLKLRDALLANMDLIDAFAAENPFRSARGRIGDRPVLEASGGGRILRLPLSQEATPSS